MMAEREHRHDPDEFVHPVPDTADAAPSPAPSTERGESPSRDLAELGRHYDLVGTHQGYTPPVAPTEPPGPENAATASSGFWQALTPVERSALVVSAREIAFLMGDVLWCEGQIADHVLLIRSGWIRVCIEREGHEQIIAFRGPGDIIGERAALMLRQRSATIVAMDDVRALRMTTQEFAAYLNTFPRVLGVLEREMYERLTEQAGSLAQTAPGEPIPQYGTHPVTHPYGPASQFGPPQRYAGEPPFLGHPHVTHPHPACPFAWHLYTGLNPYAGISPYQTGSHPAPSQVPHPSQAHQSQPTHHMATHHMATQPIATRPMTTHPMTTHPIATQHTALAPLTDPADMTTTPSWAGQNCTIVFTDIAGFSNEVSRDDLDRRAMRDAMYGFLREAFEESHVPWDSCHREDRGDGALFVIPPETPTSTVIDPMIARLGALLRRHNRRSSEAVRMQLRVALHVGPVMPDGEGVSGWPVIQTARLLDAPILKDRLAQSGADLGFIASSFVYESVIAHSPGYVNAADYERVRCRVKQTDVEGWMHLLGTPVQPAR
ncbi:cyclic nucleotide-binding domain-containing protein [Actinomadura macra]|uniref:cyclic nucleotide-binding domain-containing protein n=1 Tax=Actinomadura macra TaxID=46164 RepID=UPI000A5ACE6B|nr:cyclic nucleotide-binding domain-containing protein [Actinomadura macra]